MLASTFLTFSKWGSCSGAEAAVGAQGRTPRRTEIRLTRQPLCESCSPPSPGKPREDKGDIHLCRRFRENAVWLPHPLPRWMANITSLLHPSPLAILFRSGRPPKCVIPFSRPKNRSNLIQLYSKNLDPSGLRAFRTGPLCSITKE